MGLTVGVSCWLGLGHDCKQAAALALAPTLQCMQWLQLTVCALLFWYSLLCTLSQRSAW